MKVLHIITSLGSGGAEGMLYRLILSSKDSVKHSVICLNKGGKYVSILQSLNIDVLVVNLRLYSMPFDIFRIFIFSRAKRKDSFKIITSWLHHADLVAWFVKFLCNFDFLIWNIRNTQLKRDKISFKNYVIVKLLSILSNFFVDKVISCAKSAAIFHKKIGYKKEISPIIPNGYFFDKNIKFNKKLKEFKGTFKILLVARWHPMKDFNNLFHALDLIKQKNINFQLSIAGYGTNSDNSELLVLLKKYNLIDFTHLHGEVKDTNYLYQKSHVTVLTSAYGEAFPNVLVESMLNFTPCISTDVGDAAEILDSVGSVVPVGDPSALSEALIDLYFSLKFKNDSYLKQCLKCNQKALHKYNIQDIAKLYCDLWVNLL